jgi:type IV pilus assembly protein PilB
MIDGSGNAALLRFLVRAGLLTNELAQAAETHVRNPQNGKSLIDWLKEKGAIDEEKLARSLAESSRLPFVDLPATALDSSVTALVREELAVQHQIVPLRVSEQTLSVAMVNPLDRAALRAIEFATGKRVDAEVATQTAIHDALEHLYHLDEALDAYLKNVPEEGDLPIAETVDQAATDIRGLIRDTNLAPVVKLFNSILREALRAGASDIHIEAASSGLRVRNRVDGLLEEFIRLPKWVQDPLIARCKVLAKLDITEHRVPQDGRIQIRYGRSMVDLRVSSLPTQYGEKITMRVLDSGTAPTNLDRFAFSERDLNWIRQAITRPEGIILVTGPTGSGKTTTLYGMIAEIISPVRNIITIENPIEYQMDGVNQVEINEKQGLTFAGTLRSILRQDPDVILVGEIRDAETAGIALRAAQTGHLVLSTLHTNDAVCTIMRLLDLGIEPYMLASSLNLVIAQRLVRRVCEHCTEPYEPDPAALRQLEIDPTGKRFQRGRGCKQCRASGYAGRVGVFEVLPITPRLAKLIEKKSPESALRAQARADGMTSLSAHAAFRACIGATTVEEVLRVVDVGLQAARCPSCDRSVEDTFAVCPHCATILRRNCTSCGQQLEEDWQICPHCAAPAARLALPAAPLQPATAATPLPARPSVGPRQYRALVVDDHVDMRRLISLSLEHSNLAISVVTAASGAEAIDLAQQDPPDLVLLDVMMPGMDGFAVCEQLRGNVRTAFIPILMLTARDDAASRARGFLAGTDDYLGKPFARAELLARVRRLIERTYGAILPSPPTSAIAAVADASADFHRVSLQ